MAEESKSNELQDKPAPKKGLLSYTNKGSQTVFQLFGIELTAPAGLKNPGIVYVGFIVVNLIIFLTLRSFISS